LIDPANLLPNGGLVIRKPAMFSDPDTLGQHSLEWRLQADALITWFGADGRLIGSYYEDNIPRAAELDCIQW
jgi:hypothetical protein